MGDILKAENNALRARVDELLEANATAIRFHKGRINRLQIERSKTVRNAERQRLRERIEDAQETIKFLEEI